MYFVGDQMKFSFPCVSIRLEFGIALKCLSIGTPKTINFPFVPNGKLMYSRCPNI